MAVKMKQEFQQEAEVQQEQLTKPASAVESAVDEYVLCRKVLDPMKDMIANVEKHRKSLQSIATAQDPEGLDAVTLQGTSGRSVTFLKPGQERKITDMNGLIGALKTKMDYQDLMKLLSMSLTELDKILSPLEQEAFVQKVAGSRRVGSYTSGE